MPPMRLSYCCLETKNGLLASRFFHLPRFPIPLREELFAPVSDWARCVRDLPACGFQRIASRGPDVLQRCPTCAYRGHDLQRSVLCALSYAVQSPRACLACATGVEDCLFPRDLGISPLAYAGLYSMTDMRIMRKRLIRTPDTEK